jgi:hypothetical protein
MWKRNPGKFSHEKDMAIDTLYITPFIVVINLLPFPLYSPQIELYLFIYFNLGKMSSSIHKNGNFPRDSFNESYVKPVELTYSSRGFFKSIWGEYKGKGSKLITTIKGVIYKVSRAMSFS